MNGDLFTVLSKGATESEILHHAVGFFQEATEAHAADIFLVEPAGGLVLRASTHEHENVDRLRIGRGVGLVGSVLAAEEPAAVTQNLLEDERYVISPLGEAQIYESAIALPIPAPQGVLGIILLRRTDWWPDAPAVLAEAEELARHLSGGLRMFRASLSHGSHLDRLGAVTEVTGSLAASPYLEEILQLLVNLTAQRFNYKVVTVRLLDERRKELILRATQATNKAYQNKRAIALGESIAGKVMQSQRPAIVADVQEDPEYVGHDLAEQQGLHSMICLPLTIQNRSVGVMTCYTGEVREFSDDEIHALESLAKQAAVSIEHAKLQVRNTLMQEMHHRVKNNLQQVASLLRLQLRQSHYKDPEQALTDSLGRVLAIATVHELLSREDLDHVDMRSIAETLGSQLQSSVILPGKQIRFSIRGDEIYLNTNQATQVALVMNELIQNAVEHGFEVSSDGDIHVTIEEKEGQIGLWVSNNGDPLPDDFDMSRAQLGLQIIQSLARALGGFFRLENRLGWTVAEVKFTRTRAE
jgi:two-component sensor histidine kinase